MEAYKLEEPKEEVTVLEVLDLQKKLERSKEDSSRSESCLEH